MVYQPIVRYLKSKQILNCKNKLLFFMFFFFANEINEILRIKMIFFSDTSLSRQHLAGRGDGFLIFKTLFVRK